MAFPVVQEAIESNTTTAGTSHVVTLPTATSGQLLLILLDKGSTAATIDPHGSLTELLDENLANGLYVAYRQMDGTEPASYTLVSSASTRSAHIAYRISGAENPATQAPVIATTGSGSSATPDPPASATPPSTKDYLFVAFYGADGEEADDDTWSDTPPTNYTPSPPRQKSCGVAGVNLGGLLAAAERQLNTGVAENPGTFAKDVSAAWRSQTITVHPASTQTFPQTLTATAVTSAATRQLQANKTVTASIVASAATLAKQMTSILTATAVTALATMTRGLTLGRTLTATAVSHIGSMTRTLTFGSTLTATAVTSTATRQLQANKTVTAVAVASTTTLLKEVAKALTASVVSASATMTRIMTFARTLTVGLVSHVATMQRELSFARTLSATAVTSLASMARGLSFGRTLSAISTVAARLGRYRSHGLPFLFTAANWGAVRFYLEVFLRAGSGTARARLYNDTDGTVVSDSELSTTSGSYVRLRSGALTLTDGKVYAVQFGADDADTGAFRGARIIAV